MKKLLTKELVASKMAQMASDGKKISLTALHAALGSVGSMTTLMRLKSEIEFETQPKSVSDSPEGLIKFREVWGLASEEGRKQQEAILVQLRDDQKALAVENERLDGLVTERTDHAQQLVDVGAQLESDLKVAKSALLDATQEAKRALLKLSAEQTAHADEVTTLRRELGIAVGKSHEQEIELVRVKAHLEAGGVKPVKA